MVADFFKKIKDKLFPRPEDDDFDNEEKKLQQEDDQEEIQTSSSSKESVDGKQNKIFVIAASSLLITAVIYFMFFSSSNEKKDVQLEQIVPNSVKGGEIAKNDSGKSPFEFDKIDEKREGDEISLLEKPQTPDIPKLPDLAIDDDKAAEDLLPPIEEKKLEEKKEEKKDDVKSDLNKEEKNNEQIKAPQFQQAQEPPEPLSKPSFMDPKYAPIIVIKGGVGPALGVGYEKNIISIKSNTPQDLEKSQVGIKTTYVEDRNNVIAQGKMLNAVLETAINTEVPGSVRAVVSRDVYGEAGNNVLIARGSRLYGTYSTETARGRARVQINWTRLIRPDGVDLAISSSASDQFGRAGLEGEVDNKYSSVVVNSLLTSLLAVGGVVAAEGLVGNNGANTTTVNPSTGSTTTSGTASTQAIYNVSKNVTDAATKLVNEYFDARPVIRVPQGTRITVIVNADMKIPSMKR